MPRRKQELAKWGEYALEQLRGPVASSVRRKIASFRDPRARFLRRRRRAKQTTVASASATGVVGGGSFVSFRPDLFGLPVEPGVSETMLDAGGVGLAVLAVFAGVGTVRAGMKYRGLKRAPIPDAAPEPVELPPQDSSAREPMRRLRDAERSLHAALEQMSASGTATADDSAADTRATAQSAATALRQVAARLRAVEGALPHTPQAERAGLDEDVRRLRAELDEGVDSYGHLVAAAGRVVAASGATEQRHLMRDATDRLAGLAAGLRELSGGTGAAETDAKWGDRGDEPATVRWSRPDPETIRQPGKGSSERGESA